MKTLNEVIKAFECCEHGEPDSKCEDCPYNGIGACTLEREANGLNYLKEYQRYQNKPSRNGHMALVDYFEESQKNEPLTWDELKLMEGKPVWVVVDGKERWHIIKEVTNEHLILESWLPIHKCWMNHPNGWQAYRLEKK